MIWINVTTTMAWRRPPVGVVRVELEVASHLLKSEKGNCRLCHWTNGRFYEVQTSDYLLNLHCLNTGIFDRNVTPNTNWETDFRFGDMFLSMGLDWDHGFLSHLHRLKRIYNLKIVGCCYDIIPIKFPHFCVGDVAAFFASYFIELASIANHILCISDNSKRDLSDFLINSGAELPSLSVFRLGDSVTADYVNQAEAWPEDLPVDLSYLLLVSTIERRKNHQTAYLALRRIIEQQMLPAETIPHLVIVGMKGWGVEEFFSDIVLDPITKGYIHILNHVTDEELRALYLGARFTIYPSFYEGWGLPVCESLCYGKVVICSQVASLPEAGGDFVVYCDPYSPAEWAVKITELCSQNQLLHALEERIRKEYMPFTWKQSAQEVAEAIRPFFQQQPQESLHFEPGYDLSTLQGKHIGGRILGDACMPGIIVFGPHIRLPCCWLDVKISFLLSSDFDADLQVTCAAQQKPLASQKFSLTELKSDKPISEGSGVYRNVNIRLASIELREPKKDIEVVIELNSGIGLIEIDSVDFELSEIPAFEALSPLGSTNTMLYTIADVNRALRTAETKKAKEILEEIRTNLSDLLYTMKMTEIERQEEY